LFVNLKEKSFKAIEINPRFGGGYPLSYAAGANFPKMLIQEYILGKDVEFVDDWEDNLLMLRYDSKVLVHDYKS
jgi:carbamoyl-phosphate synthase large subunit